MIKNDFDIMKQIQKMNGDIRVYPLHNNFLKATMNRDGTGEIVIKVDNLTLLNIDNYVGGLYLINKNQYQALKELIEDVKEEAKEENIEQVIKEEIMEEGEQNADNS